MDPMEFFAQLPRGKEDKPLLFGFGPITYNRDEVDGLYYMLDRDFSGCLLLTFAKPMDPTVQGWASLDGELLPPCVLKHMPLMMNMWALGIPLRGYCSQYGKEYTLHVEGFRDTDGNEMDPQDFTVKCLDRVLPLPEHAAHEAVALQAAQDGIVLLKNNGVLPLAEGTAMHLYGKGVNQFRDSAVGAGKINPRYHVDFVTAIRESSLTLNEALVKFYRCDRDEIPGEELLQGDLAVMLITRGTGENLDNSSTRGEFYLSEAEEKLLRTLRAKFPKVLTILNVGYPMDVTVIEECSDAIVYNGFGGMLAGRALVDVLTGKVNPNGHLPDTWAKDYFDIPSSRNFYDCADKPRLNAECGKYLDTVYEEGVYVGYRYFDTFSKEVAYPFGYGLSYTTFDIAATDIRWNGRLCLTVTVTNTGSVAGKAAPQVYVKKPGSGLGKELAWFGKTDLLQPGEAQIFHVQINNRELAVFSSPEAAHIVPAGQYVLYAGHSVNCPAVGGFEVEENIIHKAVTPILAAPQPPVEMSGDTLPDGSRSGATDRKDFGLLRQTKSYPAVFTGKKPAEKITYPMVKKDPALAADFVAQMSVEELARITVCASAGWGMEGIGEAGRIFKVEGYQLPDFPVSDGNSGVNLNTPNIGMPSSVTVASSFDARLMEAVGRTIGEEAKALGMPLILAPGMNLHRNPLNGRQPEYFSEDPYFAGTMGGVYCRGMESAGVGSCIKHMIANNCESARKSNHSIIGERALRELYLKAFAVAMETHMPASIMTAYNACNGRPTAADEDLLMGFLREEQGFRGFAMTDWTSYDTVDVAEMVEAGMSWITPGSQDDTYTKPIVEGVASGKIRLARLQENVQHLIETIIRFA